MPAADRTIYLIAHNLRSCHNVGSPLRTAEGLGLQHVYLTGYTPYPLKPDDNRLPHLAAKLDRQIRKTALGAEMTMPWSYHEDIAAVFGELRRKDTVIAAIEQHPSSIPLPIYEPPNAIALLVGREVEGIEPEVLSHADTVLEIPMFGSKESFNVVQAAAMAMYHCRFTSARG